MPLYSSKASAATCSMSSSSVTMDGRSAGVLFVDAAFVPMVAIFCSVSRPSSTCASSMPCDFISAAFMGPNSNFVAHMKNTKKIVSSA